MDLETKRPSIRHAEELSRLTDDVSYFESRKDTVNASRFRAALSGTKGRLTCAKIAAPFIDSLGLSDEVTGDSMTRSDAENFVAKVLHEIAADERRSHYARGHAHLKGVTTPGEKEPVRHADDAALAAPWDPAADIAEHLGLSDPAHVAGARSLVESVRQRLQAAKAGG